MSPSPDPAVVRFDVSAADEATEIFLVNGNFELVGKGIGSATFSAPPGLYKLKLRSGSTSVENVIAVREGMGPLTEKPVPIMTPVPIPKSANANAGHEAAVRAALERTPDVGGVQSAAIVITVRYAEESKEPQPNPGQGLKLLAMDGSVIADVAQNGKLAPNAVPPIVTLHAAVAPGAYRLALERDDKRRVEQIVVASRGWTTQVFLFARRDGGADLVNGAITVRKDFVPDDPSLRLEQIVLGAFRDDRRILSDALRKRIADSAAPPMLALLGALLLIREAKTAKQEAEDSGGAEQCIDNRGAVATIVSHLRDMLGPESHPDVEAIAIGAGSGDSRYVFDAPPMFRASWRLLLKASAADPKLVPQTSWSAAMATRLWGEGPWLLYFDPGAVTPVAAVWQDRARDLLGHMVREVQRPARTAPSLFAKVRAFFTPLVRRPFPDLRRIDVQRAMAERGKIDVAKIRSRLDDAGRRLLVKRLGVPMSSIDAWLDEQEK